MEKINPTKPRKTQQNRHKKQFAEKFMTGAVYVAIVGNSSLACPKN